MALSDDDVSEILRIIDESQLDELRIETDGLQLHVVRGGAVPPAEAEPRLQCEPPAPPEPGARTIDSPTIGTFYRAPAPGAAPFPAGMAGSIAEIHVANAAPVEHGQPLFRVDVA